ncbi:unnamed protein product [Sphenostylis stenocarpa]|uniref:Uncharacterized protein n=1 Tax=Sphenostylis stenocarpa TaxID=92480 RepID=A0AA86SJV7_9FABA|nr:unnamed protein product [Sphenostylis stenocarpa]
MEGQARSRRRAFARESHCKRYGRSEGVVIASGGGVVVVVIVGGGGVGCWWSYLNLN